jgi:hypothetical protein
LISPICPGIGITSLRLRALFPVGWFPQMPPLTLDDLITLEEYVAQRSQHTAAQARYLDRYRRVRIGPRLTLTFENRQTLWFRIHELLRVARLNDPLRVQQELDLYNRLLPSRGRLQAALQIDVPEGSAWAEHMRFWREFPESMLRIQCGAVFCSAHFVTCRPEDCCFGTAHWVEFALDNGCRAALADRRKTASIIAGHRDYSHQSGPLSEPVRQSLLDDLALSDRDRAA